MGKRTLQLLMKHKPLLMFPKMVFDLYSKRSDTIGTKNENVATKYQLFDVTNWYKKKVERNNLHKIQNLYWISFERAIKKKKKRYGSNPPQLYLTKDA